MKRRRYFCTVCGRSRRARGSLVCCDGKGYFVPKTR